MKKFEEAKATFEKSSSLAFKSGKSNKDAAKMIRECELQMGQLRKQEKAIYQKMFKWPPEAEKDPTSNSFLKICAVFAFPNKSTGERWT